MTPQERPGAQDWGVTAVFDYRGLGHDVRIIRGIAAAAIAMPATPPEGGGPEGNRPSRPHLPPLPLPLPLPSVSLPFPLTPAIRRRGRPAEYGAGAGAAALRGAVHGGGPPAVPDAAVRLQRGPRPEPVRAGHPRRAASPEGVGGSDGGKRVPLCDGFRWLIFVAEARRSERDGIFYYYLRTAS